MRRIVILTCLGFLTTGLAGGQLTAPIADKPQLVVDAEGHSDLVKHVMFTPSGKYAITVGHDKSIRIWDLSTGETTRTMRLPSGPAEEGMPYAAAAASTGYIAVGGMPLGKGKLGIPIHLVNPKTGRVDKVFKGHENVVTALAFSKDGKLLASGSSDRSVRVWDVKTGKSIVLAGHLARIRGVAWSPDGKKVAASSADGTAKIWALTSPKAEAAFTSKEHPIMAIAWSADGKTIATSSPNAAVVLWDAAGKQQKVLPKLRADIITSIAFAPDSKELLYTGMGKGNDYVAAVIDLASGKERFRAPFHNNTVLDGSFSFDGKLAATTGGNDNETYVWNAADGTLLQTLAGKGKTAWSVAWSPDGKSIAWGTTNQSGKRPLERTFNLEDLEFGEPPTADFVRTVASQDGWSLEQAGQMQVIAKQGPKIIHTLQTEVPKEPIYAFTMLKDGRAVLGGSVGLWLVDPQANRVVRRFRGHTSQIFSVAPSPDGKLFISAANDMTIRLWDPDKEEPLLSFFFTDTDWVAWTPEGYFAASPGGERLVGWQINHGADLMASYYPASRFRASLYLPDAIKKVVPERSVAKALLAVGRKPNELLNVTRVLPPQVTITSPAAPAMGGAFQAPEGKPLQIEVSAKSTTSYPITSLRLLVDGRPYKGDNSLKKLNPGKMATTETWTVDLPPGSYSLSVQAQTQTSKGMSSLVEVSVGGKEPGPPNLYVFAVGINDYPGALRLKYAAGDADNITAALKKTCTKVFGKIETRLIKDKQASKAEIMKGLAWLKNEMTPRDVGVIFFSGHGGQDKSGNMFLIPVDANVAAMQTTCIPGDWLKNALGEIPGRLIAIMDACHSGSVAEGGGKRKALFDDLVRDLISDDYGVIVMCASLGREYALEGSDVKAGYYTTALIEGLNGKADLNNDGEIFLNELEGYAARRVKEMTRGAQNPTTAKPPNVAWFPLVKK